MASCAVFGLSLLWISADMPRVNGMLMSTSGRQKKPRSARITRKSWASASMAPPANACPWMAATVGTGSASTRSNSRAPGLT